MEDRAGSQASLRPFAQALLVTAAACAACAAARAEDMPENCLVVASDGDDGNTGTVAKPFRTIRRAMEKAQPGTTVCVRKGIYDEEVVIEKSGTADKRIVLQNCPGERPVIDPAFKRQFGIRLTGSYVTVRGFEIRNCRYDPKIRWVMGAIRVDKATGCLIEGNVIHHIVGEEGGPGIGIFAKGVDRITIQNNTVYDVVGHSECMGIELTAATNAIIRRNLVYLCDKEGIRLITDAPEDTNTESVVEGNISIHNHTGIAINYCHTDKRTIVRNNFCGWNWVRGINPKHTKNVVVAHNMTVGNEQWGLDIHGNGTVKGDNYGPVVENNLFSLDDCPWWIYDAEVFDEKVDSNFYHTREGSVLALFNWSGADRKCRTLQDLQERTKASSTVKGPYELHGRQGDPMFADTGKGDFRLRTGSPAKGAADDGKDMGALEEELIEVGADRKHGLANIPDLGQMKLTVESFSSETEKGRAANVVDGVRGTYWEIDVAADAKREIVLAVPGDAAREVAYIAITKIGQKDESLFYREFELLTDDGAGAWKPVPAPPEHPFVGFKAKSNDNGEVWRFPEGTKARKVKIRFVSGYGKVIRLPEIRLYGRKTD